MNRAAKPTIKPPVRPSALFTNRDNFLHDVLIPSNPSAYRFIRAPKGDFGVYVENMKLLARIYNGITLVNGLIDGTILPGVAIAELLKMGSLTPDVLKSLKTGGGQTVMATIDALSNAKFGNSPELTKAKDDLINIFAAYRSQAIFTAVANVGTEKTEYETALNECKTDKTLTVKAITAPHIAVTSLAGQLSKLGDLTSDTDPTQASRDLNTLKSIVSNLDTLITELPLYADVVTGSNKLKNLEQKSAFLQTLAKESEMRLKIMTSKVVQNDKDQIVKDARTFAKISQSSQANQNVYGQMSSFVATQKFKNRQNRKYTSGFPDGTNDLNLLATNTADSWLQKRINGNQKTAQDLKKGLSSLDGFKTHLETAEDSWKPVANKIDAADSVLSLQNGVAKLGIKEAEVVQKVTEFLTCQLKHAPNPIKTDTYDVVKGHIESLNTKLNELSDFNYLNGFTEIQTLKDAVDLNGSKDAAVIKKKVVALKAMKDKEVKSAIVKLNQFEADVKALEEIMKTLIDKILGDLSTIDTHVTNLKDTNFEVLTNCVKDNVGDYGENIVKMFESIRNIEAAAKDTPNAKAYWTTVFASSDLMDKTVASAAAMKNVADRETKALAQLKNPTGSQDFGLAVQGLVTIETLDKIQTKLAALTGDVQDILDAADDHKASLSTEHYDTLKTLRQLSTDLNTMFGEIKTVKGSVGKLGETNLEVNKAGFDAAAKIKPVIVGDVKKMKAAIQSLKSRQGLDQAVANHLADVETALDILAPLDLDFANYKFSSAGSALKALDLFFVQMTQALATTLPPPTSPAPPITVLIQQQQLSGPASGLMLVTEAPGNMVITIVGCCVAGLALIGALIGGWCCYSKNKKKKEAAAAAEEEERLAREKAEEREEQIPKWFHASEELVVKVETCEKEKVENPMHFFLNELSLFNKMNVADEGTALNEENLKFRRYNDIYRIDTTAARLTPLPNAPIDPATNAPKEPFIHANVMQMTDCEWIMAQGPMDGTPVRDEPKANTIETHWMLIEQKAVALNIQLCHFIENDESKCARYYPEKVGDTMTFGVYRLTVLEVVNVDSHFSEQKEMFTMIRVQYEREGVKKTTDILRYFGWGDRDTPKTALPARELIAFADTYAKKNILVHCSAGIGRTGTLTGIKKGIEMCMTGQKCGLNQILSAIRECRYKAVQTANQIAFMMLGITDGLVRKINDDRFIACLPAIQYYFDNLNNYPKIQVPKRQENNEPMLKKDKKTIKYMKDEDDKIMQAYVFLYPKDALADIEAQHAAVAEAKKKWEEKHKNDPKKEEKKVEKKGGKKGGKKEAKKGSETSKSVDSQSGGSKMGSKME